MVEVINRKVLLDRIQRGISCRDCKYSHLDYPSPKWLNAYADHILEAKKLNIVPLTLKEFKASYQ